MEDRGRGGTWAAVEVVVAVLCALGAAGLLWWLGWSESWSVAAPATKGTAKVAVLGLAGLVGASLWLRRRRDRSGGSEE